MLGPIDQAHYAPRPYVHHGRRIQTTLAGLDVGDVREPRRVGAVGLEFRPTRSSADQRFDARFSPEGRLAHARVTPRQPSSRMMRATRFRDVRAPSARSGMNVLGAP